MKTQSKHTPGPWTIEKERHTGPNDQTSVTYEIKTRMPVYPKGTLEMDVYIADNISSEANARLIAAAPELLTACKGLLNLLLDKQAKWAENDEERHTVLSFLTHLQSKKEFDAALNTILKAESHE